MGINATDFSGLGDSTTYYFKINGVEYSVETGTTPTYQDVCDLVDAAITSAGFRAVMVGETNNQDIRVLNIGIRGHGSLCTLANGTTGADLFDNLNYWSRFRKPTVYAYSRGSESLVMIFPTSGSAALAGAAVTEAPAPVGGDSYYGDSYYGDGYYQG